MKYNFLGDTGLLVSQICFGTMTFGGNKGGFWEAIGKLEQSDLIAKTGAYFSTFSYNSPSNNQLNSTSNFHSIHDAN